MLRAVSNVLRARDYSVLRANDGESALDLLAEDEVDLILLDLGLPGLEGHDVIERLRNWSQTPVIVLSVREANDEKVAALDAGADDYLTKPFATKELLARMRAVLRRTAPNQTELSVLRFNGLELDLSRQLVILEGEPIHLTPTEYRLLEAMATSPGKLMTHRLLLQKVWGPGYGTESNYLRLYIRQLRQKLGDDPARPKWITTEPGLGYRWLKEPTRS
ncbi:MAG: response regulator transcription factor [Actinomycetota bacterium]|nr:response regulator transcription factor [Actinomycetota bacterium]